jgi:hypothetical protein
MRCRAGTFKSRRVRSHTVQPEERASSLGYRRDLLPYFPLIARRNWRIMSRELCSIVPSW